MTGFNMIFNVIWVIFVGLISAIASILTGIACCLTLIGIPFGLQHFKFVKLALAPAGKSVFSHFGKHPVMNVIWLIFGGIPATVLYFALALLFAVTIVGLPLAAQLFKIAKFNFAPFGAEILAPGEYTKSKNTMYDFDLLTKRIIANPDVVLSVDEQNMPITVRSYLQANASRMESEEEELLLHNTKYETVRKTVFGGSLIVAIGSVFLLFQNLESTFLSIVLCALITAVFVMVPYTVVEYLYHTKPLLARYFAQYGFLFERYPQGSPQANCKIASFYYVTKQEPNPLSGKVRTVRESVRKSRISTILDNIK